MKGPEKDTTLTPLSMIAALGGPFDTDPCAFAGRETAKRLIVWPEDGLAAEWAGSVWCNPPYSDPAPWMERMSKHANGVALVLASTDTRWFQRMAQSADGVLWLAGRPKFLRVDGTEVGLMRATVLVGWGEAGQILSSIPLPGFYTGRASVDPFA